MNEDSNMDKLILEGDGPDEARMKFMDVLDETELMRTVNAGVPITHTVFILCDQGEMTLQINLDKLVLHKGQFCLVIYRKNVQFLEFSADFKARFVLVSDEAMEYQRQIYRVDTATVSMLGYLHECPTITLNAAEYETIDRYYRMLQSKVSDTEGYSYRIIVISLLQALFLDTYRIYQRNYRVEGPSGGGVSRNEAVFMEFVSLVHQYHRQSRNVGFYAAKLYITPKYLSSIVKLVSGRNAKELIDDYIISEAKVLLAKPRMNVQQVAFEFNFATQTFFGKYFKRHTGISPGDYKNTIK